VAPYAVAWCSEGIAERRRQSINGFTTFVAARWVFKLGELAQIAETTACNSLAVHRESGTEIIVPNRFVHWKQDHYAAI